jgi:tetratricopeptide (TPR) repeat protein
MEIDTSMSEALAAALDSQRTYRANLANTALSTGITLFQDGKTEKAIAAFKTAAAYNPGFSEAYKYMGVAYAKLGNLEEAIKAYKKPVQIDPSSTEARTDLANAYIDNKQYDEAEVQFNEIIKLNPRESNAYYSLGQLDLQTGKYDDAIGAFKMVVSLEPNQYNGYYGLGLAYNKQERYEEAVKQFEKTLSLKRDFAYAYADLGYAYAGLGEVEKAQEQVDTLVNMNTSESKSLAAELSLSLYTPKIIGIDTSSTNNTFTTGFGPGTNVAFLDPSLWTPGASHTFSVVIQFNQAMDLASVQNTLNWSISKASGGTGGWYNNGITMNPEREISIPPMPTYVAYDPSKHQATVFFTINQNSSGNGITDPSHWIFKFTGTDISGNKIDTTGDEYDEFAGEAF